jgi:DNA-binding NtrC family response regulator
VIQHAFVLCTGKRIEKQHLPEYLTARREESGPAVSQPETDSPEAFEAGRIRRTLERNRYSRAKTARELGMHPTTLWRKMKKLGIG